MLLDAAIGDKELSMTSMSLQWAPLFISVLFF